MKESLMSVDAPMPRGKIKIENFENGKKVDEVEKTNFVYPGMQYVMRAAALNVVTKGRVKNGYGSSVPNMAQTIVLADDDKEVSRDIYLPTGKMIGFADLTAAQTPSELQGTINVDESVVGENLVRLVVDFPTQSAVGRFNSVQVGPAKYYGYNMQRRAEVEWGKWGYYWEIIDNSYNSGEKSVMYNNYDDKKLYKYNFLTKESTLVSDEGAREGASYINGKIISWSGKKVQLWQGSDLELEKEFENYIQSVASDGNVIWVDDGTNLYKTRPNLEIIQEFEGAGGWGRLMCFGNQLYSARGLVNAVFTESNNNWNSRGFRGTGNYYSSNIYWACEDFVIMGDRSDKRYIFPGHHNLSRVDLDGYHEKRKGQTMKVTYEYEFPNVLK